MAAKFRKNQSYKDQRVHITGERDQGGTLTGKNISFSISNDTRTGDDIFTDPMLVYDAYQDANGNSVPKYDTGYSKSQWDKIEAAANKDGDKWVLTADLMVNSKGKGLIVNTNSLKPTDVPFNQAAHSENTKNRRAEKEEMRAAKEVESEQNRDPFADDGRPIDISDDDLPF